MTPYTMKPPRARYSSGLLSAARDAVLRACWVADMPLGLTWRDFFETCHPCHLDVLAGDHELDGVGGDAVQRDLQPADVHRLLTLGELHLLPGDVEGDGVGVRTDELGLDAEDAGARAGAAFHGDGALVQATVDVVAAAA